MKSDLEETRTCKICGQSLGGEPELCTNHAAARKKIEEAYPEWKERLGLQWVEYLTNLYNATGTGLWIRETTQYLAKNKAE